jgi:hypothetical protein
VHVAVNHRHLPCEQRAADPGQRRDHAPEIPQAWPEAPPRGVASIGGRLKRRFSRAGQLGLPPTGSCLTTSCAGTVARRSFAEIRARATLASRPPCSGCTSTLNAASETLQ